MIAARFRYKNLDKIYKNIRGQLSFPGFTDNYENDSYVEEQWRKYYEDCINYLYNEYPCLLRQVLIAVTYPDPDKRGVKAENYIKLMLSDIDILAMDYDYGADA